MATRTDAALACLFAVAGFALSFLCGMAIGPKIVTTPADNVWFDGDAPEVFEQMTDRWSGEHYRSHRHPLFGLLATMPTWALSKLGLPKLWAVRLLVGLASGASALLLYLLLGLEEDLAVLLLARGGHDLAVGRHGGCLLLPEVLARRTGVGGLARGRVAATPRDGREEGGGDDSSQCAVCAVPGTP